MIFVTVGAQTPFDRLIRAVDLWAGARGRSDVFAQIGATDYRPQFVQSTAIMDPSEFRRKMEAADVVIAHVGLASILTALEMGKPLIVMPRRLDLRETPNDQQVATAKRLLAQGRLAVAFDEVQLLEKLDYLDQLRPAERIAAHATPELLAAIRAFIHGQKFELPMGIPPVEEPARAIKSAPIRWQNRLSEEVTLGSASERLHWQAPEGRFYSGAQIKSRVSAVILLAGRLRTTDLGRRAGRSRLDLPIDQDRSILTFWRDEAVELAQAWRCRNLTMRVLLDQASPNPTVPASMPQVTVSLERDKAEFRGTGGVLHDACAGYDDDDWVLVANAAQLLFEPLRSLAGRMAEAGGEINVVRDGEGIPNGLILLRCGLLRSVPDVGYHDMKEQVIPSLAKRHRVKVISTDGVTSLPIHSLKDYTETLRSYHRRQGQGRPDGNAHDERWQPQFSIREPGSTIAPSAVLHDAVILQGGVVERDALVVRSVIGHGARVRAGEKVIDEIVI